LPIAKSLQSNSTNLGERMPVCWPSCAPFDTYLCGVDSHPRVDANLTALPPQRHITANAT
jgi:hypothetical protein